MIVPVTAIPKAYARAAEDWNASTSTMTITISAQLTHGT